MDRFTEPILHVDMDAFFVEVERLRRPELRGLPVIVGGLGNRGVVAAASYEARRHGVHSAMPMAHARRLCPHARFLPPDHARYREVSRRVFALLDEVTPLVEPLSIDEAFCDIGGLRLLHPHPVAVGEALRRRIREAEGLPASVGIAATKFIAKLASEEAKPDGLCHVPAGTEVDFLHPMPARRLWGVGEATHARLEGLGVRTVGELAALPRDLLVRRLGEAAGAHLADLAWGRDPRRVETDTAAKSVSVEETYERDLTGEEGIDAALFRHAERLGRRLRAAGLAARSITLKLRFGDFTTFTRSTTLPRPVDGTGDLAAAGRALLARLERRGRGVRLLGLGATGLEPADAPRQLALRGGAGEELTRAADRVRDRFGEDAVVPARLVPRPGPGPDPGRKDT